MTEKAHEGIPENKPTSTGVSENSAPTPLDAQIAGTVSQSPEDAARAMLALLPNGVRTDIIPGYEIEGEIGRGGMGVVYRARQLSLNRLVAIKMARDRSLMAKDLGRFLAEAKAVAAIKHPNVVHVYDYGENAGRPFMVLEFCGGGTLADRLGASRLNPQLTIELVRKIAHGVAAAHDWNIVHRDLKPSNILFDETGEPKVTDFGIAKLATSVLTATQAVMGTPAYMSPEQARGDAKFVGPQADVWAIGVILYECLTGVRPFEGGNFEEVRVQILSGKIKSIREYLPTVPSDLEALCLRCLAHRPGNRYQTAGDLKRALNQLTADPTSVSLRRSRISRTPVWARYLCVAAVSSGVSLWLSSVFSPHPNTPTVATDSTPDSRAVPTVNSGPIPRLILPGESGTVWAVSFLSSDRLVTGTEDGSIKIWNLANGEAIQTLDRQEGNIWAADVSADGRYLVTASDESSVTFWSLKSFKPEFTFPESTSTRVAAFSPDGKHLATGNRSGVVKVWDWANQIPYAQLRGHRGTVHGLAYSPDGTRLASAGSDRTVKVWELRKSEGAWELGQGPTASLDLTLHRGAVYTVAFSPDGKRLASAGWDGTVRIWDASTGTQLLRVSAHEQDVWSVAFGADGKWVASASSDGSVIVSEVETGNEVFAYRNKGTFNVVRFAPNGTTLAAGGRDGSVRIWDIKNQPK